MKKFLFIFIVIALLLSLCSCGGSVVKNADEPSEEELEKEQGIRALNRALTLYNDGNSDNYEEAFRCFLEAADCGVGKAYDRLAFMYLFGIGTSQNSEEAEYWFSKASELGSTYSQIVDNGLLYSAYEVQEYYLPDNSVELFSEGMDYYYGLGTAQNYALAKDCFTKAAELYNALGYYGLGLCSLHGNGCEKNTVEALRYFLEASSMGCIDADCRLLNIYSGKYPGIEYDGEMVNHYLSSVYDYINKCALNGIDRYFFDSSVTGLFSAEVFNNGGFSLDTVYMNYLKACETSETECTAVVSDFIQKGSDFDFHGSGKLKDAFAQQIYYYLNRAEEKIRFVEDSDDEDDEELTPKPYCSEEIKSILGDGKTKDFSLNSNYWLVSADKDGKYKITIVHIPIFKIGEAAQVVERFSETVLFEASIPQKGGIESILENAENTENSVHGLSPKAIFSMGETNLMMEYAGFPKSYILFWTLTDYRGLFGGNETPHGTLLNQYELGDILLDLVPADYINAF